MSEPKPEIHFVTRAIYPAAIFTSEILETSAAEELLLLHDETTCAVMLLQYFRDKTSADPKADLRAAFEHIENALAHSRSLRAKVDVSAAEDLAMLHRSMQHFQTVLSDIPQISFLSSVMIDSYHEIKEALVETRQILKPVEM